MNEIEYTDCALCDANETQPLYRVTEACPGSGKIYEWNLVCCNRCGLSYLNPRPRKNVIGQFYPKDYYTYRESDSGLSKRAWLRSVVLQSQEGYADKMPIKQMIIGKMLVPLLSWNIDIIVPYVEGGRILDVGCGNGERVAWMREFGWDVHGVEIAKEACVWAEKRGVKTFNGDLLETEYPDKFFDVVVMNHVLEHLHQPIETLKECRRILKREGLLIIDVPNFGGFDSRFFGGTWNALDLPRHLYHFTKSTLRQVLVRAGFKVISQRYRYVYRFREKLDNMAKLYPNLPRISVFWRSLVFSLRRYNLIVSGNSRDDVSVHLIIHAKAIDPQTESKSD